MRHVHVTPPFDGGEFIDTTEFDDLGYGEIAKRDRDESRGEHEGGRFRRRKDQNRTQINRTSNPESWNGSVVLRVKGLLYSDSMASSRRIFPSVPVA